MAGILSFALGLEAGAFSSGLDRAGGRLLAFLSVGKLVQETFSGVWSAIERGGALTDLSARTGESVNDLYKLQEAFATTGISADSLPGMINRLNMSLSGVSETGLRTDQAFGALGLNIKDLKSLNAADQFAAITEQLALMDKASAVDVASRIFGREGAGNILQISRDAKGFNDTMRAASKEAAVFARNAVAFDTLGDTITRVKGSLGGMFAGIAEGVVPTLQGVADALNAIDLVAVGQNIGTMLTGAFQAFKEGNISVLISDTIVFGFQSAVAMIPALFQKLGSLLLRVFEAPLEYLQASIEYIIQKAMEGLGKIPGVGKATGLNGFKSQSFGDILAERKDKGAEFFTEGNTVNNLDAAASEALSAGVASVKEKWAGLFSEFATFAERAPKTFQEAEKKTNSSGPVATASGDKLEKPSVSSLEKMGFIFNGGAATDPARDTATNTKTLVDLTRKMLAKKTELALTNI